MCTNKLIGGYSVIGKNSVRRIFTGKNNCRRPFTDEKNLHRTLQFCSGSCRKAVHYTYNYCYCYDKYYF